MSQECLVGYKLFISHSFIGSIVHTGMSICLEFLERNVPNLLDDVSLAKRFMVHAWWCIN